MVHAVRQAVSLVTAETFWPLKQVKGSEQGGLSEAWVVASREKNMGIMARALILILSVGGPK